MAHIDHQQLSELEAKARLKLPVLTWHSAAKSHVGRKRRVNEDAFISSSERGLWAVADGMGGRARGDYASGVVVEALVHFEPQPSLVASIMNLEARLAEAHNNCRNAFKGERVGSTVVAMYVSLGYCFCLWAGDSRVYRLRAGELSQLTLDHSLAQEKFARGEISQVQAAMHPGASVLTRAVGVHQSLHLDLIVDAAEPGDRYLLCSDGLYNEVSRSDILQRLSLGSVGEAADSLIERALDNGGRDNVTVVVADVLCAKRQS